MEETTLGFLHDLIAVHCHVNFWRDPTGGSCHILSFHGKHGAAYGLLVWKGPDLADCIRRAANGEWPDEFVRSETDIW
jgi:hypothetical protein